MKTSTIELMKAEVGTGGGGATPVSYLNIVTDAAGTVPSFPANEVTKTTWGHSIRVLPDLELIEDEDTVPAWMSYLYGNESDRPRLRPMNPHNLPEGLTRTWRYVSLLRRRRSDPETFHRFLAADTVAHLRQLLDLRGARVVDIGGQAGFMSEALRDEGAQCLVVEHTCDSLEPHDGLVDRAMRADAASLPLADAAFDLVYSSDVLQHTARPEQVLAEAARVLKRDTGIGYVAFTNTRSALALLDAGELHHPVSVEQVLTWFRRRPDLEVVAAGPRYWPSWADRVTELRWAREVATGSLRVIFRRH